MAALSGRARRAWAVAAATVLCCLGTLTGASAAQAQTEPYPPGGGPFVVSTTLVIAGGHLTFTATLPFGEPIVVQLNLPPLLPLPGPSPSTSVQANVPGRQDAKGSQTLAALVPDAHGHVSASVTVPRGTVPGEHVLTLATARGHHALLSTRLQVVSSGLPGMVSRPPGSAFVADSAPGQALTARRFAKPILAAGAMTVGAGFGGWALRRRRPRLDD